MNSSLRDIIVNVRRVEVSAAESPFMALNIHFTGECDLQCDHCHSQALWKELPGDNVPLHTVLDEIDKHADLGLISAVCIMGTDNEVKRVPVRVIVDHARQRDLIAIIYTGLSLNQALTRYGQNADLYVCGPYRGGEWYDCKQFYQMVTRDEPYREPLQLTKEEYFSLRYVNSTFVP